MSFDARSLERLQQLGRSLPQPLPKPSPEPGAGTTKAAGANERSQRDQPSGLRHRVETEEDPQALFRELMQVSPDGQVPPHWMERLKELEHRQQENRLQERQQALARQQTQGPQNGPQSSKANPQRLAKPPSQKGLGQPNPRIAAEHGELYTAFQQLLLEDDSDGAPGASPWP